MTRERHFRLAVEHRNIERVQAGKVEQMHSRKPAIVAADLVEDILPAAADKPVERHVEGALDH